MEGLQMNMESRTVYSLWPLAHSDQLLGNAIFTVAMDWHMHFVHSSCVQYFLLQQMVVSLFRSGSWAALRKKMPAVRIELLAPKPTSNSHLCWKKSFPPHCKALLEDEQRCWPWSIRNESILTSSVQCNHCFWVCSVEGCSDVCCGKMTQYFLIPLTQNPLVQHSASGAADHLWDTSCLLC